MNEANSASSNEELKAADWTDAEPGAYPQEDGTVLIVLKEPIQRTEGDPVTKVSIFRELTAKEEDDAGGKNILYMMQNSAYSKIINRVTNPMITGNVFMRLSSRDRTSLMQGVLHFLT